MSVFEGSVKMRGATMDEVMKWVGFYNRRRLHSTLAA